MPTYAYRCDHCGVQFDRYQAFNETQLTTCPECGEKALRKLFAPVGIVFKGSGFYATDHRSPSGQTAAKKAETAESADKPAPAAKTTE
ncbi:MAG TPA: FmdB family zinc ribbon protein [Anaerolineales bacterium]|nr:FmdB family zinc ribbon protein [Anaerolineales bacterium]